MPHRKRLRLPAIEVFQSSGRKLYTFAVDGKLIPRFATVSRIRRKQAALEGYQRPEVLSHIHEIRNYLESQSPMIPNAVVIAFDPSVHFEPTGDAGDCTYARPGTISIPIDVGLEDEAKPGFIVDGQQRLAAIRDASIERFPICVTAFITNDIRQQTEQFILVNSTKPLPKGLIYELLPGTDSLLPSTLYKRRFPAYLLDRLNRDEGSPLLQRVQTPTTPEGIIKDNSLLKMLENSLTDGVLYRIRRESELDVEKMLALLKAYWAAVRTVFSEAWGLPPKKSRLMHGAGIIGMGFIMDAICDRYREKHLPTREEFEDDLTPLRAICRWTEGYWDFGPGQQRKWNEVQNTPKDVQMLCNYLLVRYKALVWNQQGPLKLVAYGIETRQ